MMKTLPFYRLKTSIAFLSVVLLVFVAVGFKNKANAFSTTTSIQATAPATNSANITGSGTSIQPWFAVGRGAYDGPVSYAKVYVPAGKTAVLTVVQGKGICGSIDVGSPSVSYLVTALDNAESVLGGSSHVVSGSAVDSIPGSCGSFNINLSGGNAADSPKLPGHEYYDVYYFEATINNSVGSGDHEKNFRLSVGGSCDGAGHCPVVGVSRNVKAYGGKPWFGIYMRDAPSRGGNNWDYAVQSAPFCSEDAGVTSKSIAVHDIDWQVYNQPNLEGLVDKDDRAAAGFNWNLAPPGQPSSRKIQNDWPSGSGTNSSLTFAYDNANRYLLEFRDIDWHNTIQIALPFDQFDSQAAVGKECNNNAPPPLASACSNITIDKASPQPAGTPANISMTFRNTGQGSWTSGFYIKRTGPSYKNIKTITGTIGPTGTVSATDSIVYPNQATTYTYTVFTASDQQISGNCSISISPPNQVTSCDALPDRAVLPVWDGNPATQAASQTNIKATLYNGGSTTFPGGINGYTLRQVKNAADPASAPNGGLRYLSNNLAPGNTDYGIAKFNIAARTSPTTLNFYYTLFAGDQAGDPVVGKNPLCHTTITWSNNPCTGSCSSNPGGRLSVSCSYTATTGVYVPATYHPTVAPYETYIPPGSWAAFPSGPPQAFPPYTGTHYTYTPPAGSGPAKPITVVPARIHVQDLNDGRQWDYRFTNGVPNGTSLGAGATSAGVSTFGLGSQAGQTMWPHHQYQLTLYMEGSQAPLDSATYQNNGAPGSYSEAQFDQQNTPDNCLTASCLAGSDADIEPGQSATLKGGIQFNNQTLETYTTDNSGGYNMRIDTNGGFSGAPGAPVPTSGSIGPSGSSSVQFSFDTLVNWQGSYNWTLLFGSDPIGLGGLQVPCPGNTVTPSTRPFFQVWGGDINTGGGFYVQNPLTGAFSCPGSYPGYVSPAVPGVTGDPSNYGGIKAFGSADGTYGSFSDFGAVAFGLIAQNPTGSVPAPPFINFSANPKFSNNSSPVSSGGELNGIPTLYDCMPDFFDTTQNSPTPIGSPSTVDLGSIFAGASQQYIVNGGSIDNLLGGTIPAGVKVTIFVDGDVTIKGNITYGNWSYSANNSPSFTLVAKGNINVDPAVSRLDGLYIAQPRSPGNKGEFNTCATNSGNQFCNQQLVVNGAVITRRLLLLRSVGTVSPDANPSFSPAPGHNAAEIFNYIPSMVLSSPNFKSLPPQDQARFNLPPVF